MLFLVKERLEGLTYNIEFFGEGVGYTGGGDTVLDFRKKSWGQLVPKFSFSVARTSILVAKNYINGFSFVKDNGLSLVYVFPKK